MGKVLYILPVTLQVYKEMCDWFQEMLLSLLFIHDFLNMHFVSSLLHYIIGAPTYILAIFVVK